MALNLKLIKKRLAAEVEGQRQELLDLSLRIHAHPEVGFQEERAAAWLTTYLEGLGFSVERGLCGLPTAFRASYGSQGPAIAFLAEYDALPKLGHGCGHNIIAAAAVGAAAAARQAADRAGGQVVVIGTPAEEISAGKAIMAGRGAFQGLDAAMLAHPGTKDAASTRSLACIGLTAEFFGRAAHAASRPHEGINALEALILSFNAIDALRQHIRPSARIHGIITSGGEAANIVPAYAAGEFLVRAEDYVYLDQLKERALGCFRAGGQATGARLEYRWAEVDYAPMKTNQALARLFAQNMEPLGRRLEAEAPAQGLGSTDMGNVSQLVPAIHPSVAIAPSQTSLHSAEFAQAAISPAGHQGLLDAAKAMAMTAADLLLRPEALRQVREEFLASSD